MHPDVDAPPAVSPESVAPPYAETPPASAEPQASLLVEDVDRTAALAAEATPPTKPEGAPDLWPFIKLPRRKRAEFLRGIGPIFSMEDELKELAKAEEVGVDDFDPVEAAKAFDLMADIEDILEIAVPPGLQDRYREWVTAASDEDLMNYLNWYMTIFQPGADPSTAVA